MESRPFCGKVPFLIGVFLLQPSTITLNNTNNNINICLGRTVPGRQVFPAVPIVRLVLRPQLGKGPALLVRRQRPGTYVLKAGSKGYSETLRVRNRHDATAQRCCWESRSEVGVSLFQRPRNMAHVLLCPAVLCILC